MRIIFISFLILMMSLAVACDKRRSPSRYLIPEGYVGWVRIDFNISGAPVLEKEDGYWRLTIPESGRFQTSSNIEYGVAHDEYYYYSADGRTVLKETGSGGNGLIWAGFNGSEEDRYPQTYKYFFVGTEAQLKEFGWKSKDADGHPSVGNIKTARHLMKPVNTVSDALKMIDSYEGRPEEFFLPVSEELLDPVGVNMAIIGDRILSRNWEPNGFEQHIGFRLYRYKALDCT